MTELLRLHPPLMNTQKRELIHNEALRGTQGLLVGKLLVGGLGVSSPLLYFTVERTTPNCYYYCYCYYCYYYYYYY